MRWLRRHTAFGVRLPRRLRFPMMDATRPIAALPHDEILCRWLAADTLAGLCRSVSEDLGAACGLSSLLIVAFNGNRPSEWALAPDASHTDAVGEWFDHQRRSRSTTPTGAAAPAPADPCGTDVSVDPELARLGFRHRLAVAVEHGLCFQVYWSGDRDAIISPPGSLVPDTVAPAWWDCLRIVLTNYARMEHLRELSHIDAVTGVFNRRYFNLRLAEEVARARRFARPLALLIADLDQFKPLNDSLGHQAGDLVLRYVGQAVHHAVRAIDIVCRLGGDEFAVLLPDTEATESQQLAERLCRVVRTARLPLAARGGRIVVTLSASLGGAVYPSDAAEAERLLWCADMALLDAKRCGGDRYVFHGQAASSE